MDEKCIEQKMFDIAVNLINKRYPKGWGGAGVIRTENDSYYSSVWLDAINPCVQICIETGAMCEAHKYEERVTHSLCVVRNDENSLFKVLSPCGVCQERLRFWGEQVLVGVTTPESTLKFVALSEIQQYHYSTSEAVGMLENYDYFQKIKHEEKAAMPTA